MVNKGSVAYGGGAQFNPALFYEGYRALLHFVKTTDVREISGGRFRRDLGQHVMHLYQLAEPAVSEGVDGRDARHILEILDHLDDVCDEYGALINSKDQAYRDDLRDGFLRFDILGAFNRLSAGSAPMAA